MSDIQTSMPVTPPAEGLENISHTEAGIIKPVEVIAPPAIEGGDAPADVVNASILVASTPGALEHSFIRDELTAILFGLTSGFANGIERVKSLIQHVESRM